MKNITVTLPDEIARRTRVEAAQVEKSVSRFIADLLAENVARKPRQQNLQREAIERFLSGPDIDAFKEPKKPLRDYIYADFRRFERDGVQPRSPRRRKKS